METGRPGAGWSPRSRRWGVRSWAALAVALAGAGVAHVVAPASRARADATSDYCLGTLPGAVVPRLPAPPLRFGITPGAVAGQVGLPASAKPESAAATLSALRLLAPAPLVFVLRLNRFFWSDGEPGIERFLALAHSYTWAGFEVELQLRYRPPAGHTGDVAGWADFVREVVRRFAPDPGVIGAQVTNEVNFTASPDSSDGANAGARDALIAGVIAAKQQARALGDTRFRVGFNWFYRTDPSSEQSFWGYLASHGGAAFRDALDWVGLDAYPGTFFPPIDTPGGERDAMANALSSVRCYMASAGIGARVPIYIEENGWPTGPARSDAMQQQVLETMVGAVNDLRGAYGVTDYRWFDLRDADSSSPNFQQQFGLLRDDYSPKPAFASYGDLVAALGARRAAAGGAIPPRSTRRRRHVHSHSRRCAAGKRHARRPRCARARPRRQPRRPSGRSGKRPRPRSRSPGRGRGRR